jgi:5-methylthioadenosine/S-adenosylhomocysteine deaminase
MKLHRFPIYALLLAICVLLPAALSAQTPAPQHPVVLAGATIVTMDSDSRIIQNGLLIVDGTDIRYVGPNTKDALAKFAPHPASTIELQDKLILPGLINAHTHAAMTLLRGIRNDSNLDDWLTHYIFPAEAKNVNEEFVRWGTRLAAAEMIRSGTTTFTDMYYFPDTVATEAKKAGLRAIVGSTFIDFPAPDNKTNADMLANGEKFIQKWKADPLITPAVAPHSMYTNSAKTLQDSAALARKYDVPILIHVAETEKELDDSLAKHQMSPVAYLNSLGILGPDVVAAHCVHVNADDRKLLAQTHTGCAHNPSSNMMLASGVAPVRELREAGVAVGLGTDGPAGSNNDLDMMEEMDLAAKLAKIYKGDPQALSAKDALQMATLDGARALHMEKQIGSLEAGKRADLIVLDLDVPNAVPLYDVYAQIVYSLKASDVTDVMVNGKFLYRDRKLLTLNQPEILQNARELGKKVQESLVKP